MIKIKSSRYPNINDKIVNYKYKDKYLFEKYRNISKRYLLLNFEIGRKIENIVYNFKI